MIGTMAGKDKDKASDFWNAAGRTLVAGGTFVKEYARELYDGVDPDVKRHLAQMPLLTYTLLSSRQETIEPGRDDGHPPLVFVHGMGGSRGDFMLMSWYLWFMGRKRSYRIFFDRGQTIGEMAKALARFIRKVKKVTGQPRVDLVAHSLGGVVCRMALAEHRLGTSVATLVTMGSPHQGTWSARYASTANIKDLRPDSDLVHRLNSRPWPRSVRVVNFFSTSDLLVVPPESALTKGAEAVDMSPFTHYSYLLDRRCWARVHEALQSPV